MLGSGRGFEECTDAAAQAGNCSLGEFAQKRLEFAECHFDGVQIG
jgi:hypothetical protein